MSILEKIKEFIRKITNRVPQIEEAPKKEIADGFIAPKGQREDDFPVETLAQRLQVLEKDFIQNPVVFETQKKIPQNLLETLNSLSGYTPGRTHEEEATVSGKINGKNFVSLKRKNVQKDLEGQTICVENGYYDIKTQKDKENKYAYQGDYKEKLTLEDGTDTVFYTTFSSDEVFRTVSKNGIKLTEKANKCIMGREDEEFEKYAQPSEELAQEYAEATGLPIITDKLSLGTAMQETNPHYSFPFIVEIKASKEADDRSQAKTKTIKYAYTSLEEYRKGQKPYMIYIDGIDGRTSASGMFRLKGDSYVDNSTFRRENGQYTYDTISYEEIIELAGKMPTQLSPRAHSTVMGKFKMPSEISEIYNKSISIEKEKENPNVGIGLSD